MSTAAMAVMATDVRPKYIVRRYIFCQSRSVSSGFSPTSNLAQAAGDVVAERRVDDRLDHLGRRIRLADSFQPGVGADAHEHGVLAAGRLRLRRSGSRRIWQTTSVIFMGAGSLDTEQSLRR